MSDSIPKPRRKRVSTNIKEKHYCPICGCLMDPNGSIHNPRSETKDHIYPKSRYDGEYTYQILCKRCNSLKGSAPPAAITYKAIEFMRVVETTYSDFHPQNLTIFTANKSQSLLVATFKPKAEFCISLPGYEMYWVVHNSQGCNWVTLHQKELRTIIRKVFFGSVAKRVQLDIPIKKLNN